MTAFLPTVVLLLVFAVVCTKPVGLRVGILISSIVCACYLTAITESLILGRALTPLAVLAAWIAAACVCLVWMLLHRERMAAAFLYVWTRARSAPERLDPVEWFCLLGIVGIVLVTGLTAISSPPNTADVMDYHMPRVSEWILRQSVGLYPTHYLAQLFYPPYAEWMILHHYLLAGDDRFSNIVQWLSFDGSIIAVSLIAKLFGGNRRVQLVSALLCVTLPQGVLAASGAKNDWTAVFWLTVSCVFLLRWAQAEEPRMRDAALAGLALGLAVLTKGTTYLFAPAILLGCLGAIRRRPAFRGAWQLISLPVLVLVLNAPQYVRNYKLSGSPIGYSSPNGDAYEPWRNSSITPQRVAANVIRNVSLHLGTRSDRLNNAIGRTLAAGIRKLGVDPDDPATTWSNSPFRINSYSFNEYFAGNPLHLVLIVCVAAWTIWRWRRSSTTLRYFMLGVICAYIFYCAYVHWNRWGARLQLAPFVLGCPILGCVLVRDWRRLITPLLVIATLMALPDALININRPLLGLRGHHPSILRTSREHLYFVDQAPREGPYLAAIAEIRSRGCHVVGVDTSQDVEQFEYPFFAAFSPLHGYNIRDTGVTNASARFASTVDSMALCSVICLACTNDPQKMRQYAAQLPAVTQLPQLVLFEREPVLK